MCKALYMLYIGSAPMIIIISYMLIMTFLIAQGQSHVLKFNLLFQLNITEAKLFFDLMGFEPRTSGSAVQYPNH